MRTIKQLLELMLEHQELFGTGLCRWVLTLHEDNFISTDEYYFFTKYIKDHKPLYTVGIYYWKRCEIAPRIKWINTQIKNLKN